MLLSKNLGQVLGNGTVFIYILPATSQDYGCRKIHIAQRIMETGLTLKSIGLVCQQDRGLSDSLSAYGSSISKFYSRRLESVYILAV